MIKLWTKQDKKASRLCIVVMVGVSAHGMGNLPYREGVIDAERHKQVVEQVWGWVLADFPAVEIMTRAELVNS